MRLHVIVFAFAFLLCACQDDDASNATDQTFDESVRSLAFLDQPEPLAEPKALEVVEEPAVQDGYECSVKMYDDQGFKSRDLGFERKRFTLNNLPGGTIDVIFTKFDTKITVRYRIRPLF